MIFTVGTAIGIIFGICIYEGIYHVQTNVFGLLPYRGYNAEWVVSRKTFSPFLTPITAAAIGVAVSYAIVILKLDRDMNITAASGKMKRRGNVNTTFGAVSRVLSQRAVGALQIISLVCVIFANVVSYLYCVKDEKGKSVVASTTLNSYNSQDKIYEVSTGIDLDKLKCDCFLKVSGTAAHAMYLAPNKSYGMKQRDIDNLGKNGAELTYGWSTPFKLLVDANGSDNNLLMSNLINKTDCEQYGLKNGLSAVPCILMNDTNDKALARLRAEKIGFVFQFFKLIPELTAKENILFPSMIINKKPDKEYISELSQRLGIDKRLKHYPSQLSGGQQQRAAIARALINDPDILLCDKPTGNLDEQSGNEVMELLEDQCKNFGKTIIIVTHDMNVADRCDNIIEISDGKVAI